MGTCCFTPKKTQFLWWYWLALASIIGIPMFLAAWYVQRNRDKDLLVIGPQANKIFWISSFVLLVAFSLLANEITGGYWGFHSKPWGYFEDGLESTRVLAIEFVMLTLTANAIVHAFKIKSRQWLYLMLALWMMFILSFPDDYDPKTIFLMAGSCFLPARAWQDFLVKPGKKPAWMVVAALVIAIIIFCLLAIRGKSYGWY